MKPIGLMLWGARVRREMTLTALAKQVGVSRSYIHSVERGLKGMTPKNCVALAQALGLDPRRVMRAECRRRGFDV